MDLMAMPSVVAGVAALVIAAMPWCCVRGACP
jgi:hypothetical protein